MTREDLEQIGLLMDTKLEPIKERLDGLEADITGLKDEARFTRVLVEKQQHNIQLIAEQYGDISAKLDKANDRAAQMDDMRERLRAAELTIMQHSAILEGLAKAQ